MRQLQQVRRSAQWGLPVSPARKVRSSTWETHCNIPYGLSAAGVLRASLVGVSRDQTLEEEGMVHALVKVGIFIGAADLRYRL